MWAAVYIHTIIQSLQSRRLYVHTCVCMHVCIHEHTCLCSVYFAAICAASIRCMYVCLSCMHANTILSKIYYEKLQKNASIGFAMIALHFVPFPLTNIHTQMHAEIHVKLCMHCVRVYCTSTSMYLNADQTCIVYEYAACWSNNNNKNVSSLLLLGY